MLKRVQHDASSIHPKRRRDLCGDPLRAHRLAVEHGPAGQRGDHHLALVIDELHLAVEAGTPRLTRYVGAAMGDVASLMPPPACGRDRRRWGAL